MHMIEMNVAHAKIFLSRFCYFTLQILYKLSVNLLLVIWSYLSKGLRAQHEKHLNCLQLRASGWKCAISCFLHPEEKKRQPIGIGDTIVSWLGLLYLIYHDCNLSIQRWKVLFLIQESEMEREWMQKRENE